MNELSVAVIGAGGMGRHHIRILSELAGARLVGILDKSPETAAAVSAERGGVPIFASLEELMAQAEAVVLAVPTVDHAELGCRLLAAGKHVLVEKPIAASLEEADRLVAAAAAAGKVLALGHVEFFNPAVEALLATGARPRFLEIERLSPFSPRSLDVDVVLDLMIHDLQILHALDPAPVAEIRATGIPVLSARIDIASVRIELQSGCVANLTASRVSAERVRKLRAFLPNRYYSLDYMAQEVKGVRLEDGPEGKRILPADLAVERAEPLRRELESFLAACRGEASRWVRGEEGRRALATARAVVAAMG
ncbi:MAG TPA: Gfo/Idh/MocA family oxidoreductase [Thermoanaerobaculia bacterium]|nr:Gfo/Idh/MocA family oxidoreductase [Thermoanaerobaculia bacterium]